MTFRQAAEERWKRLYGTEVWGPCEGGCDWWVPANTAPHHIGEARGGIGGKRKHDPDLLRFLCDVCHDAAHGIKRRE